MMTETSDNQPQLILRLMPAPRDINANGHIFGGWVLSQMDIAGGIIAARAAQGAVATVAVDAMEFLAPIHLHDIVSVYGEVIRRGRTSLAIKLDVRSTRRGHEGEIRVTHGIYTFVALDEQFRPKPLPPTS
jgi:acyl-CoA thioesterase YciA